jgi:single-strand DNA-binding protein
MSKDDFNKVVLMGNLGDDPIIREFPGGNKTALFSLAVNRSWKDDKGEHRKTTWVDCRLNGKGADIFQKFMKKGRRVLVEGRLEQDKWTDDSGAKREKMRVVVREFHFADSRKPENGTAAALAADAAVSSVAPETSIEGYTPDPADDMEPNF